MTHAYRLDFMLSTEQRNSLHELMATWFNYLPLFSVAYLSLILEEEKHAILPTSEKMSLIQRNHNRRIFSPILVAL